MKKLESVHRTFLKRLLGVPVNTPNKMVYAECGRIPLKHFWWKQSMNYMHRMHALEPSRLCKNCLACCAQEQHGLVEGLGRQGATAWTSPRQYLASKLISRLRHLPLRPLHAVDHAA